MTCVHCGVGPDAKNAGFDGLRSTNEGTMCCGRCWWLGGDVVGLALSIRRFVRRAEVDGLVDSIDVRIGHGSACARKPCDCGISDAFAALDRLAELAKEGA